MAAHACGRGAKERLVQVFDFDQRASRAGDVLSSVAAIANQPTMFAFERIPSLAMVKRIAVPLDDRKVFPVMLGVAADALLTRARRDVIAGVQSRSRSQPGGDLVVAIKALEVRFPGSQTVACGAICRTVQRLVRAGKRSGRYLRG